MAFSTRRSRLPSGTPKLSRSASYAPAGASVQAEQLACRLSRGASTRMPSRQGATTGRRPTGELSGVGTEDCGDFHRGTSIFDRHLGAQFVKGELLGERRRTFALGFEQQGAGPSTTNMSLRKRPCGVSSAAQIAFPGAALVTSLEISPWRKSTLSSPATAMTLRWGSRQNWTLICADLGVPPPVGKLDNWRRFGRGRRQWERSI